MKEFRMDNTDDAFQAAYSVLEDFIDGDFETVEIATAEALRAYLKELRNQGYHWVLCDENERPAKVRYQGKGTMLNDPDLEP